jgi:hypothetical protein
VCNVNDEEEKISISKIMKYAEENWDILFLETGRFFVAELRKTHNYVNVLPVGPFPYNRFAS